MSLLCTLKGGGAHPTPARKSKVLINVVEADSGLPVSSENVQVVNRSKGKSFNKQLSKGGVSDSVGVVVPQVVSPTHSAPPYQKLPCPVCGGGPSCLRLP